MKLLMCELDQVPGTFEIILGNICELSIIDSTNPCDSLVYDKFKIRYARVIRQACTRSLGGLEVILGLCAWRPDAVR